MSRSSWYGASISTVGVALAAAGGLLLLLMLFQFVGPFRYVQPRAARPVREPVLWLPGGAAAGDPATALRLQAWRRIAPSAGALRQGLGLPQPPDRFVLVLPDARRLAEAELSALRSFVHAGGGAVLAGSLGVRDAADAWLGYAGMGRLLEVERVTPRANTPRPAVQSSGRGPLAGALAPGADVDLLAEAGLPAISGESAELTWRAAEPAAPEASGASRRLERGEGRLVWVAVGPESGTGASQPDLERVLRAAVAWASREPVVGLRPRPGVPMVSAADLEEWERTFATLDASVERTGAERLRVSVTHRGHEPLTTVALDLYAGRPVDGARVTPTLLGQELPEVRRERGGERLELWLPELRPGSQAWHIDWTEPLPAGAPS